MAVRLLRIRSTARLGRGTSAVRAVGRFLVLTVRVINLGDVGVSETEMTGANFALQPFRTQDTFPEAQSADTGADRAVLGTRVMTLRPGRSLVGDLVFDVPPAMVSYLRAYGGALLFSVFGQDLQRENSTEQTPFGYLILTRRVLPPSPPLPGQLVA
jgi:hypothetical protein